MSDARSNTTFLLRLRGASPAAPTTYPVDVTLDNSGSLSSSITLDAGALAALEGNPWEYGRQLGRAIFSDLGLYRALAYARGRAARVSIALQVDADAAPLHDILWERLMLDAGGEDLPFASSAAVTLARRIPSEVGVAPPREGPFRLLLVIASPVELDQAPPTAPMRPIDVDAELRSLRDAWDTLVQRGLLQVSVLGRLPPGLARALRGEGYRVFDEAATLDALADRLSDADSLHLVAHGKFRDGSASLLLETPDGHAAAVPERDLLGRFGERALRLVFLQACQSAARERGRPNVLSGLAPKLARRAAAVVAMQDFVRVDDARRFAQEFYDTLLGTGSVDLAVNAGRRALYRPDSGNWAIPALYAAPGADPLWQPDGVLRSVQEFAEQLRTKPETMYPFPVEVIRKWPGVSSKMETSPPGPRMRVLEAVSTALYPDGGARAPLVVVAGNYGRAKTAQLYSVYLHYARQVSRGDSPLPLFAHMSEFHTVDETPAALVAGAVSRTYAKYGIDVPAPAILRRLAQPFLLCVDDDQDADARRRTAAFDALAELTRERPDASAVLTLDEQAVAQMPALQVTGGDAEIPVLLVQLLSPATVAQYLTARGDEYQPLLAAIQRASLFDLAGVPWLLSHLIRQANRVALSRSGVITRVVNGNLAAANLPGGGVRRMVHELLGRIAWVLQNRQAIRLDGAHLYELMDHVRGRREVQLEQLKAYALSTRILAPSDEDGVRFSYPGFQSHWCAQYLLDSAGSSTSYLEDITATLGRRNRVRLWEDTLVLLAGMMASPDRLIRRILAGSGMGYGEQAFLAARCIHEAKLVGLPVADEIVEQVLDSLIWRSTPMKETSAAARIRATECLALLTHPRSVPHLVSLALERVRPTTDGPAFELAGLRHAALQVLLTMQEETAQYVTTYGNGESSRALAALIAHWRAGDTPALMRLCDDTTVEGLPPVVVFAIGTLGGDVNLTFLADRLFDPATDADTRWSIAESLLQFDPRDVTRRVVSRMRGEPSLRGLAAYMIGKLRVAALDSEDASFLVSCLSAPEVRTRGMALKALAQLGDTRLREACERMAQDDWTRVAALGVLPVPESRVERMTLRVYAVECLRLFGTEQSLAALREARTWRPGAAADRGDTELLQLSYEVSEDIYWRLSGGADGDLTDPGDRVLRSRQGA